MDLHSDDRVADPAPSEDSARDIEAPEADAVEQHTPVRNADNGNNASVPLETDEADVADQRRVVELDEDDYR
ncbi:MAG TPA: hypothetical protein VKE25_10440 [Actinomycetes bacterium]|nr:hypothetical protein [Actinomycetes bacterium]